MSTLDFEAPKPGLAQPAPFNRHLGLAIVEVAEGRAVVRSQHAGALFSAGEAASGEAMVGAFAARMGEVTPLTRSARIDYSQPAKGRIDATAVLAEPKDAIAERLEAEGRAQFPIEVELVDAEGQEVAAMAIAWQPCVDS